MLLEALSLDSYSSMQGKFSMVTAMRLGVQMLESIEGMHEMGFLHRDIKPVSLLQPHHRRSAHPMQSNFAMGLPPNHNRCFIIDFGLARRYSMPNGEIRPVRVKEELFLLLLTSTLLAGARTNRFQRNGPLRLHLLSPVTGRRREQPIMTHN